MSELEQYLLKGAEVSGTPIAPVGAPPPKEKVTTAPTYTVRKEASVTPYVNLDEGEAPHLASLRDAQHYALPSCSRYPLDSYEQVKTAAAYFEEYRGSFAPVHRREYCVNLVKRAGALGIPVSADVRKYGSEGVAPAVELSAALEARERLTTDEMYLAALGAVKTASVLVQEGALDPESLCCLIEEYDKLAGLSELYDRALVDPYYSVYGEKTAAQTSMADTPKGSVLLSNEFLTSEQLHAYAKRGFRAVASVWGEDFAREFQKDPVSIFNSLPAPQKKVVARLATDNAGRDPTSA